MKTILEYINESIKFESKLRLNSDSAWSKYQALLKVYNKTQNDEGFLNLSDKEFTDDKFIDLFCKLWLEREGFNESSISICSGMIAAYCYIKYGVKVVYCQTKKESTREGKFVLAWIPKDSNAKIATIGTPSTEDTYYEPKTDGGFHGKESDIQFVSGLTLKDYANIVLKNIKDNLNK